MSDLFSSLRKTLARNPGNEPSAQFVQSLTRNVCHAAAFTGSLALGSYSFFRQREDDWYLSGHPSIFFSRLCFLNIIYIIICRLADVAVPSRFYLYRVRLEFSFSGLAFFIWLSTTAALSNLTLSHWPPSPHALSHPEWNSYSAFARDGKLSVGFTSSALLVGGGMMGVWFWAMVGILSSGLVAMRQEAGVQAAEGWVMWDLVEGGDSGDDDPAPSGGPARTSPSRYGATSASSNLALPSTGTPTKSSESPESTSRRIQLLLITLSLFTSASATAWIAFGYERDPADLFLLLLATLTAYSTSAFLFFPTFSPLALLSTVVSSTSPKALRVLPLVANLVLYPLPTILFTLPPHPFSPPSQSSAPIPQSKWQHWAQASIDQAPTVAILGAWSIMLISLLGLVAEIVPLPHLGWEEQQPRPATSTSSVGHGPTSPRRDLFFPSAVSKGEDEVRLLVPSSSGASASTSDAWRPGAASQGTWRDRYSPIESAPAGVKEYEIDDEDVLEEDLDPGPA